MIDFTAIIQNTNAYRMIQSDKQKGSLSHAYLVLTSDKDMLEDYVKLLVSLMCCENNGVCLTCRTCRLIADKTHPDVIFYPQSKAKKDKDKEKGAKAKADIVCTEDIVSLIEESFIKPIECDKKVFVIINAQDMNVQAQNKLLKTLEEPPKNVHIVLGATSEFSLLPTVKSRVKKLEIPPFDNQTIFKALENECPDHQKLNLAVSCGDGTIGKALSLYGDKSLQNLTELVLDMLVNMNSSKDVLKYSTKITEQKVDLSQFLSVLQLLLRDLLVLVQKKQALVLNKQAIDELEKTKNFNTGSLIHALETVNEAGKRKKFNMNETMLLEWLLFQILEGKHKWQKL